MITVELCTPRKRHGGVHCHTVLVYENATSHVASFSRTFRCECGEPLHDGDQIVDALYRRGRNVHVNCVDVAEAG